MIIGVDRSIVFLQAQIVSRKKEASAEALNEARNELHSLKTELVEKQTQLRESDGQDMLKGEDVSCWMVL